MSGRRGRGSALNAKFGVDKTEIFEETNVGPPETYPPLQFPPPKPNLQLSHEASYIVTKRKRLTEWFENSEYYVTLDLKNTDIERYSDRLKDLNVEKQMNLNWSRFPQELNFEKPQKRTKLTNKRKKSAKVNTKSSKKRNLPDTYVKIKLEELEKKDIKEEEESNDDESDEEAVGVEEEDGDEEMDDGTDYANNYFDNGEDYEDDENDALEEHGVF